MYKKIFLMALTMIMISGCSPRSSSEASPDAAANAANALNNNGYGQGQDDDDNDNNSNMNSGNVEVPTINPSSTSFYPQLTFEISHNNASAVEIYYTLDGSTPTESDSHCANLPCQVTINSSAIVRAAAFDNGERSAIRKRTYTKDPSLVAVKPVFDPLVVYHPAPITASISSTTLGATIKYTAGSSPLDPDCVSSGTTYTAPITVSASTTIKAIACKNGLAPSAVKGQSYLIGSSSTQVDAPVITPTNGIRQGCGLLGTCNDLYVALSTSTPNSKIVYTVDGAIPSCPSSGTVINASYGTIAIPDSTTAPVTRSIKAIACKSGMQDSTLTNISYKILPLAPTFNPATGAIFNSLPQSITILKSASNSGWMCYSTSGTPTCTCSPQIVNNATVPLSVAGLTTVKAIACNTAGSSAVVSATYNLQSISPPTISPTSGSFCQKVTITIAAPGADSIRIRTTSSSLHCGSNYPYVAPIIYEPTNPSGPLLIDPSGTGLYISGSYIKAIACKNGVASGVTYLDLSQFNISQPPCLDIIDDLATLIPH